MKYVVQCTSYLFLIIEYYVIFLVLFFTQKVFNILTFKLNVKVQCKNSNKMYIHQKIFTLKSTYSIYMEINMKLPMLLENIFNLEAPPTKTE